MPTQSLPTTGPGASDQWVAVGAASSWGAVVRGSGDTSYIEAATAPAVSDFFCGGGSRPIPGKVVGITLHYRMQATSSIGATVLFSIFQDGTEHVVSPAVPVPVGWVEGSFRVRESWAVPGTRPTVGELHNLGVGVNLTAAPGSGSVQVSELWVEVETINTPYCYDPMDGVLPDAVVGPLAWVTAGTQPVSITGDHYLEIVDSDPLDFRFFGKIVALPFPNYYVTEIEARFNVQTSAVGQVILANVMAIRLGLEGILVPSIRTADGHDWLGLAAGKLHDTSLYEAAYQADIAGIDTHLRVVIDRDPVGDTAGNVSLYLNYGENPILQAPYVNFTQDPVPFVPGNFLFGSYPGVVSVLRYDYLTYKTYKKRSGEFKGWEEVDYPPNSVGASIVDPDIVKPMLIQPPGLMVGQSQHCCVLDAQDSTYPCTILQTIQIPEGLPTTYVLGLDYKVLSPGPQNFELVVQRESDLWYWDNGTSLWVSGFSSVTVPFSPTRVRAAALVTSLGVSTPEAVLISIQSVLAPSAPHQILIYKVFMDEE